MDQLAPSGPSLGVPLLRRSAGAGAFMSTFPAVPPVVYLFFWALLLSMCLTRLANHGPQSSDRLTGSACSSWPHSQSAFFILQFGGVSSAWNSPCLIVLYILTVIFLSALVYSQIRLGEKATVPSRLMKQRSMIWGSLYEFLIGGLSQLVQYFVRCTIYSCDFCDEKLTNTPSAINLLPNSAEKICPIFWYFNSSVAYLLRPLSDPHRWP